MRFYVRMLLCFAGIALVFLLSGNSAPGRIPSREQAATTGSRARDWLSFFPLEAGNEWIYSDGTVSFTVKVQSAAQEANGMKYFEVAGYFPEDPTKVRKLRRGPLGQILEYNPGGDDFLWYRFENVRGAWRFDAGSDIHCISGSRISVGDVGAKVEVPAGIFERTMRLDFASSCMDAGIANEYFADGIGLVQRVLHTIAGPRIFQLVSASVGPAILPAASYGIEVSADRPVYYNNLMPPVSNPWPTAKVRLIVRNQTEWPVEFAFPTSQRFDFIVRDRSGKEVLRWSDGKVFLQVAGREILLKGLRSYAADIVLKGRDGKPLPAGYYTLVGYLATQDSASGVFSMIGSLTFVIMDLH